MPQSTASLSGESYQPTASVQQRLQSGQSTLPDPAPKVASDRLEELQNAFVRKGQQISGVEECLELLRELETKDPRAAKTLLDDAFGFRSTSEGPANWSSWFGASMGRPKDKPNTYPLPKEPEIDYSDAFELVKTLKEKLQSTLPDPAPQGTME